MLLPNNLSKNSLSPTAIEFVVEDVLPGAKMKLALGNRNHHFSAHDLPLVVSIGVIFTSSIVEISAGIRISAGIERHKFLQPTIVVSMEARLVVVDEYARRDVHCVHKYQAFLNSTFRDEFLDFAMDRNDGSPLGNVHPQLFRDRLHQFLTTLLALLTLLNPPVAASHASSPINREKPRERKDC